MFEEQLEKALNEAFKVAKEAEKKWYELSILAHMQHGWTIEKVQEVSKRGLNV